MQIARVDEVPARRQELRQHEQFEWYSDTNKTTKQCQDTFTSRLQNSSGTVILNMQQSCNTDATNAWVQKTFDVSAKLLSAYKGKTIRLFFSGTNAQGQYQTSDCFVEDVTITVA